MKNPTIARMIKTTRRLMGLTREGYQRLFGEYCPCLTTLGNWERGRSRPKSGGFHEAMIKSLHEAAVREKAK